jgi:hypothetical protein
VVRLIVYNEGAHFISALQMVDAQIRHEHIHTTNVRWITIGLHDALYSLLLEKLTRSDSFGIFSDGFEARVAKFYETKLGSNSQEFEQLCEASLRENVVGLSKLLERANLKSKIKLSSKKINELDRPSRGLSKLKELRDFLAHPRPRLSGYYQDWLQEAFEDTLTIIKEAQTQPDPVRLRHDSVEAEVLIRSIEFYLSRWSTEASQS